MTQFFNRRSKTTIRRQLRQDMPSAEFRLWQRLRNGQIAGARFRRQYGIGPYVADFCCPRLKLIIEVDGDSHYAEKAKERDVERQHYIQSFGFDVLRFNNNDVFHNLEGVLEKIWRVVQKSCGPAPPSVPPS